MPTLTLGNPINSHTSGTDCPAWCEATHHTDGPHFGGVAPIDLSQADPGYVVSPEGTTEVSDFLDIALWQAADQAAPVIGIASGWGDVCLPDLTLSEAESLADALMSLIHRARSAA
jgi:uncharacterized protein DUF6907